MVGEMIFSTNKNTTDNRLSITTTLKLLRPISVLKSKSKRGQKCKNHTLATGNILKHNIPKTSKKSKMRKLLPTT